MVYSFQSLPQLVDQRGLLASKGSYTRRNTKLTDCIRGWHHSLTRKHLAGSTAAAFANYHVNTLGWPGLGYHLVIEPQNVIQTPNGPRARIVYANDISLRSYHVGSSNGFAIGICVAGDYRTDQLDEPTKASIAILQKALAADKIGKGDKSHHEFAGYSWKQCCVFDYEKTFTFLAHTPVDVELPDVYVVQEGDTLFGIANNDDRFTVEDLIRWNNISDPRALQIGQRLVLKVPGAAATPNPTPAAPKPVEQPKAQPQAPQPKILWTGHIKVATLNVRKGPGTNNPVVGQLSKNAEVAVYEELKNGWLYIGNGQYISNVNGAYVVKGKAPFKDAGKRVEAIVAKVNFYNTPRWTNPSGHFTRGQGWTIIDLITTNGSPQYKVKNSRGRVFYITARKDLVRVV